MYFYCAIKNEFFIVILNKIILFIKFLDKIIIIPAD